MSKSLKTTLISILVAFVMALGAFGLLYTAKADDAVETFTMQSGAEVRLNTDSTGLRFIAETNQEDANATYNFVIAPTYYFTAVKAASGETDWVKAFEDHPQINYFINLTNIVPENYDADDNLEIRGSIVNIKFDNINLKFTGIAYKVVDGERVYADFDSLEDISRSVTYASSLALNTGNYEDPNEPDDKAIMTEFIQKGFVKADGYAETILDNVSTYAKADGESLSLANAYAAVNPVLTINANATQKFLHSQDVSVAGLAVDLAVELATDNESNLALSNGKVQALTVNGGKITAKAGILSAEKTISVDEVTTLNATTDTYVNTAKENAITFGTGISVTPVNVYDVTGAASELGYADGKLNNAPTLGERKLAVLTADNTYYVNAVASDCVIKDKSDLRYYLGGGGTSTNGVVTRKVAMYAILTTNITGQGTSQGYGAASGFVNPNGSVFDGRGFTVKDVYCIDGWFGQGSQTNTTIKNVNIENFIVHRTGTFGQNLTACKIENVYVNVVLASGAYSQTGFGGISILYNYSSENYPTTVSNCKIRFMAVKSRMTEKLWIVELGGYNLVDTEIVTNANFALNGEKNTHGNPCAATILEEGSSNYTIIQTADFKAATVSSVALDSTGKIMAANALGNGTVEELFVYNMSAQRYLPYVKDGDNLIFSEDIINYYGWTLTNGVLTNNKNHWCAFKTENGWYWGEITFSK